MKTTLELCYYQDGTMTGNELTDFQVMTEKTAHRNAANASARVNHIAKESINLRNANREKYFHDRTIAQQVAQGTYGVARNEGSYGIYR